jgi:hypothetical protein
MYENKAFFLGDVCICIGEKSFIFILERVNHLQKWRGMHLYRREKLHFQTRERRERKPPPKWRCMHLYGRKSFILQN